MEKQRATPKDLPGEDWPWKIKTVLSGMDLDKRLDACAELCGMYTRNSVTLEHCHMIDNGSADDYQNVAKYELRGRKISNRMDNILVVIIQDNAFREQARFQTYPRPSNSLINQLIRSPADADHSHCSHSPNPRNISDHSSQPIGSQEPQHPASPSFTMKAIEKSHPGVTANPLLTVKRGNEGNGNPFITQTMVTNHLNHQDN